MKRGLGKKYDGKKDFKDKKFNLDTITFSGKDNRITTINLIKDIDPPKIIACDFDGIFADRVGIEPYV